jgi:FkbM family methyltransferase
MHQKFPHTEFNADYVLDLGMHIGDDTAYYLHRGYSVVALEANPDLCEQASERFKDALRAGRLIILNFALVASRTQTLEFHICEKNLEWSSLERWRVESTGSAVRTVQVSGLLLSDILQAYGAPAYIKCDIEGADGEFVRQLTEAAAEQLPSFVSVEGIALSWLHDLARIGFDRAQLVNQARIRRKFDPPFVFDVGGEQREWTFKGHSSGRFGLDLDPSKWLPIEEVASRWSKFEELKSIDPDMTLDNWFDFHVTKSKTLDRLLAASRR